MWDHPPTSSQQQQQPSNNEAVVKQSADGEDNNNNDFFYKEKEQLACCLANVIICLLEHDKCILRRLILEDYDNNDNDDLNKSMERKAKHIHILHPPLRGDIRAIVLLPIINNNSNNKTNMEHYWNRHLPPVEYPKERIWGDCPPPPQFLGGQAIAGSVTARGRHTYHQTIN